MPEGRTPADLVYLKLWILSDASLNIDSANFNQSMISVNLTQYLMTKGLSSTQVSNYCDSVPTLIISV